MEDGTIRKIKGVADDGSPDYIWLKMTAKLSQGLGGHFFSALLLCMATPCVKFSMNTYKTR